MTLYMRQQKRHRCIGQSFGLCGRWRGWDNLGEWYWNMRIIVCEMNCQSRFYAWDRMLWAGALGWPRGMVWGWRWEGVQDGEHVSNQSILKEISPGCSLEGLTLKLKLQYFGHLIQKNWLILKRPWYWERLKVEGEGDNRGWDGWMASPTQWTWVWLSKLWELVMDREA